MRTLLTDDVVLAKLRAEIAGSVPRSWDDYSAELWQHLVEDELSARRGQQAQQIQRPGSDR